jgi:hypothetical protein
MILLKILAAVVRMAQFEPNPIWPSTLQIFLVLFLYHRNRVYT